MQLSAIPGKSLYLKWVLATSVGLALALFLYYFVLEPAFYTIPSVRAIGIYLFRWPHLIIGIAVGVSQGFVVRKYTRGLAAWAIASTVGLTLAISFGSRVFEATFNAIIKTSGSNQSTTIALLSAELLTGILFGFIIGLAQWFALRSKFVKFPLWMITSIFAWTTGLVIEGLIIMGIALVSNAHPSDLPFIIGSEHILSGFGSISAQPGGPARNEVAIIGISLLVGGVVGAITGTALFLKSLISPGAAITDWKKQNIVTKLSSGSGVALIILCMGLSLFLAAKEFDALMLFETHDVMLPPLTGGGAGCLRRLDLQPERRVIKESESMPLYAKIYNDTGAECQIELTVYITDFDFVPAETSKTLSIPPDQTATLVWMITPKRLGTYSIGVGNGMIVQTAAVSVVNMFGLTVQQAKLLSLIGTFLGPALTFPWLQSAWQQRREKAQKQTAEEQINDLRREIEDLKKKKKTRRT